MGDMAEIHGLDGTDEERLNGELATIKVSASSLVCMQSSCQWV